MASDAFTDANGTALATHDANWGNASADYPVANLNIQSNQARLTGIWALGGARYTASTVDSSEIVLVSDGTSGGARADKKVFVRGNGTVLGYALAINTTTPFIYKNNSWLATLNTGSWPDTANHTLKITASGTTTVTLEGFVDGVSKGTTTDSASPYGTDNPGFYGAGDGSVITTWAFDDWDDGAVVGGQPIRKRMGAIPGMQGDRGGGWRF